MSEPPEFLLLQDIFKAARKNLPKGLWDYLVGGAESETTLKRNRQALDSVAFRPRVLRDVTEVDCGTTLLGHPHRIPVILAPIGALQDFEPGGGAAAARAAERFGVMSMHSIVTKPSLEEIASSAKGPKAFQLYIQGDDQWVDEWIRRIIDANYCAVCITVDVDAYGHRERDIAKQFVTTPQKRRSTSEFRERFSWDDVKRIKDTHDIALILKGIATAEDAEICCDHGVDVIYVSNHGGRQLDHGRGGLDMLPEVVEAVRGRAEVIVDGGFMRGTDIVKAMALGADAVGIGKLFGFAMAAAGEEGVVSVLEILEREMKICLRLLGVCCLEQLDTSYLHPSNPTTPPHLTSPFPLIDEGY